MSPAATVTVRLADVPQVKALIETALDVARRLEADPDDLALPRYAAEELRDAVDDLRGPQ